MIYLGIDPGAGGGIAVLTPHEVRARPMPTTDRELLQFLATYRPVVEPMSTGRGIRPVAFAVLERVWGMPGWGAAASFQFGRSYGGIRMALAAQGIPFEEAIPQRWQKAMRIVYPKRVEGARRDKNITKRRAQKLFPMLTVTHAIADALLIAEFCRRLHRSAYGEKGATFGQEWREVKGGRGHEAQSGRLEAGKG